MAGKRENGVSESPSKTKKRKLKEMKNDCSVSNAWQSWKEDEVCDFLSQNELDEVIPNFIGEKIYGIVLPKLTQELLTNMGIEALGTRLRILEAIKGLVQETAFTAAPIFSEIHDQFKVFNDPIHGHVEMHPLCVHIIDTPQFQRLRYIKQLGGCYYVFPGATHNRFEHSIGVAWLAGELVKALGSRQPELGITEEDILCVTVAGLCHDLGHGPFSHMFDGWFIPKARPGYKWKHEEASAHMFDHLVEKNNLRPVFEEFGLGERDLKFIKEQIRGPIKKQNSEDWPYEGRERHKSFLYEVVANKRNGIDVDKWDYFARDCHHLGINNNFDHSRFMKFARVLEVEGQLQICSRDKEVGNLYDMFYTRAMLHRRAYQHKTNNVVEIMITEALCKADEFVRIEGSNGKKYKISETIDDMEAYLKLNDYIFHQIMFSTAPELQPARDILEKVQSRQLYKCVGQTQPEQSYRITDDMIPQIQKEIVETIPSDDPNVQYEKLKPEDIVVQVIKMDYGMKDKNPIDHVRFYMKGNPTVAIQVRRDQVSRMLPETFMELHIRVYCKKTDEASLSVATQCFHRWCSASPHMTKPKGGDALMDMTPIKSSQETPERSRLNTSSSSANRSFHSRLSF